MPDCLRQIAARFTIRPTRWNDFGGPLENVGLVGDVRGERGEWGVGRGGRGGGERGGASSTTQNVFLDNKKGLAVLRVFQI